MNRPQQLVIVRHAESMRNWAKRGSTYFPDEDSRSLVEGVPDQDIPITELGWNQARQTGVALRERFGTFNYIYHSGYLRTIETLNGILEAYTPEERARMRIRSNLFIRERDPGYTYEMTTKEADVAFPYLKSYWKEFGGFLAVPPGGESIAQMCQRVYLFIKKLYTDRVGERVLVVTHGGTIRAFRYILEHWTYDQVLTEWHGNAPQNCSLTTYGYDQGTERLELKAYNEVFWK